MRNRSYKKEQVVCPICFEHVPIANIEAHSDACFSNKFDEDGPKTYRKTRSGKVLKTPQRTPNRSKKLTSSLHTWLFTFQRLLYSEMKVGAALD